MFDRMFMCLCLGFLFACGATDLPEDEDELGTLEQPLGWTAGYGNLSGGAECNGVWFDDDVCYLPGKRGWKVKWSCTGCTTLQAQAVTNAKTVVANRASARGWTINYVTSGQDVTIDKGPCSSGSSSCFGEGTPSSFDDLYFLPNASLAREYHKLNIKLNFDAVDLGGLTNDQIRYSYGNVSLHEVGHFFGHGHVVPGNCMEVTPQPGAFALCTYSTAQNNRMSNWAPNSND